MIGMKMIGAMDFMDEVVVITGDVAVVIVMVLVVEAKQEGMKGSLLMILTSIVDIVKLLGMI